MRDLLRMNERFIKNERLVKNECENCYEWEASKNECETC